MTKEELLALSPAATDAAAYSAAKARWDRISKPLDGLGDFETLVCRLAAIEGTDNPDVSRRAVVVMCADNGVVAEGVSQCGQETTRAVAVALGRGTSSASTLGKSARVEVVPIDVGIAQEGSIPGVLDANVARGTRNFAVEPAMTEEETLRAIAVGFDAVQRLVERGVKAVAAGEMGIGNTTTTTAVLCALLQRPVEELVGRGAGLDDAGLARKRRTIERGLARYDFSAFQDERERAFAILRTFGGLDIAGLVGVCLGGATFQVPIVLDGVISASSALVAETLVPGTRDYMIASHSGREKGIRLALERLGLVPYIDGQMALGEGTGAMMLFPLLDVVLDFYRNASSFDDVQIAQYKRFDK
ncbi:MAG: nicotinate-nucleotide--dimethylbenzimidazole phosphoribosyltransferase [Thermoguttaceae bacterium]|jgi:nicotinate-nucleotide--dimethylbenzimidazole phosphoribosyltransferase